MVPAMDELKIASLLCSRLCHDLVSPIGALNNGIEVLEEETSASIRKEAIALLTESARAAIGKLLFFRVAFGAATGFGSEISLAEVKQAAVGMFASSRVKLDWPPDLKTDGHLAKPMAKLLLNFVMIAGEALHRGGTLTPRVERGPDGIRVGVLAAGPGAVLHESVVAALGGHLSAEDVEVRTAQPWFAHRIAEAAGGRVEISAPSTETIDLSAKFPAKS